MTFKRSADHEMAFQKWKTCIHSGPTVKVTVIGSTGKIEEMGFCQKMGEDVVFTDVCHKIGLYPCWTDTRNRPYHEITLTRKLRIRTARQRQLARNEASKQYFIPRAINQFNNTKEKGKGAVGESESIS